MKLLLSASTSAGQCCPIFPSRLPILAPSYAARHQPLHQPYYRTAPCSGDGSTRLPLSDSSGIRDGETPDQAYERRMRESQRVEERVEDIFTLQELRQKLEEAGDQLVVLEIYSGHVCQTGLEEEPELQWKEEKIASFQPCVGLKNTFQRTARDCGDVVFLACEADTDEGAELCDELGIDVLPTVQFYRNGKKLWEHKGIQQLQSNLGEGVLYYGDTAANGVKPSTFVEELQTAEDLDRFINSQPDNVLTVVNVALTSASPCVHVFPAVMALAKNMQGFAAFARLVGDANAESRGVLNNLNIVEVPTFIFYRGGKEVGRHVGSSRADLIGQILEQQNKLGIAPPTLRGTGQPRKPRAKPVQSRRNAWS